MECKTTKAKKILNSILSLYLRTLSRGKPLKNLFGYLLSIALLQLHELALKSVCNHVIINVISHQHSTISTTIFVKSYRPDS